MSVFAILGISFTDFKKFLPSGNKHWLSWGYFLTLIIGLIHGLGFSIHFVRMNNDPHTNILMPLLKFNLGVEVGQIIILLVALSLFSIGRAMGVSARHQQIVVGLIALGLAVQMLAL